MCDTARMNQDLTPSTARTIGVAGAWLTVIRRYLGTIVVGNLIWEFAQMPLYTIWHEGTGREIVFAAVHCTAGDVVIASMALVGALVIGGGSFWPHARFPTVTALAVLGGLGYTVFSEWLNTEIRGSWAYTSWMPTLPMIGSGVAPLARWMIVPPLALWWARRSVRPAPHLQ